MHPERELLCAGKEQANTRCLFSRLAWLRICQSIETRSRSVAKHDHRLFAFTHAGYSEVRARTFMLIFIILVTNIFVHINDSMLRCCCRRVFLLVDGRHGLKDSDVEMMNLLDAAVLPYQVYFVICTLAVTILVLCFR